MKKAVIFIDGANFYYRLKELNFEVLRFKKLPDFLQDIAIGYDLVRTYWYQIGNVQTPPIDIKRVHDFMQRNGLSFNDMSNLWTSHPFNKKMKRTFTFMNEGEIVKAVCDWQDEQRKRLYSQHAQYDRLLDCCNDLEFKRVGILKTDSLRCEIKGNKGDDVALATDMVYLMPHYDAAFVISGDFDLSPAIQKVKDSLKKVFLLHFDDRAVSLELKRFADQVIVFDKAKLKKYF